MSIEIVYLDRTTSVEKSPTYDEFIEQLVNKFFLTEKMNQKKSIMYKDEDDDNNFLEEDNYSDIFKISKLYLNIEEESSNDDKKKNSPEITSKIEEKVSKKMNSIIKEIEAYKKQLKEICQNEVAKKLKEVDNKHLKELNELKTFYEKKLNLIKEENDSQIRELLSNIQEKTPDEMIKKLEEYHKSIDKEIEKMMKEKEKSMEKKVNAIKFESLEKNQNEIGTVIQNNEKELDNILKTDKK